MGRDCEHIDLVRQAVAGDAESLSALAEVAQARVCAYVRRVVLSDERAQDLTQETMVAMLSSRDQLQDPQRFWSWLFTIANNKIRLFYRRSDFHPRPFTDHASVAIEPASDAADPAKTLARNELVELTRSALADLDVRHRMILTMRFYEDLSHSSIGGILGCSELAARVAFLRAKRALVQALRRRGMGESALAVALLAFGEATRPAAGASAIQLSTSALRESARQLLLTKSGASAAAALIMLALLLAWARQAPANRAMSSPHSGFDVHFTGQTDSAQWCEIRFEPTRNGAYEQWLRFPQGSVGPFLSRVQLWDPHLTQKVCMWVQNAQANYHIMPHARRITLLNARLYGKSVKTLPTDSDELLRFIEEVQRSSGQAPGTAPADLMTRDAATLLLQSRLDYRFPELGAFRTTYDYSALPDSLFQPPSNMSVVDERDEMHFRGWTYVQITGQLAGRRVIGTACIPFVLAAYAEHPPWLRLRLEDDREVADIPGDAWTAPADARSARLASHRPGSFLIGLPRPWSGLHTLDVIRRDAAARRIWFETRAVETDPQYVTVRLIDRQFTPPICATYRIDLVRDVLDQVTFGPAGVEPTDVLEFHYVQNLGMLDREPVMPTPPPRGPAHDVRQESSPLWPYLLASRRG